MHRKKQEPFRATLNVIQILYNKVTLCNIGYDVEYCILPRPKVRKGFLRCMHRDHLLIDLENHRVCG